MIKIENVSYKYKNGNIGLRDINLNIKEGECVSIIGNNGSGKSTLARLIAGIDKPSLGTISIGDINTCDKKRSIDLRKLIGIVFQNPENQIIFNRVYDDIAIGLKNLDLDNIENRIDNSLKKVKMSDFKYSDLYEMSMGQKQRIAIASAIATVPKYIVFDEPTAMIDSIGKEDICNIVKELKNQGNTILYITNSVDEILMTDRIIILDKGMIIKEFDKKEIMNNLSLFEEVGIKTPVIVDMIKQLGQIGININLDDWTISELMQKLSKEVTRHGERA